MNISVSALPIPSWPPHPLSWLHPCLPCCHVRCYAKKLLHTEQNMIPSSQKKWRHMLRTTMYVCAVQFWHSSVFKQLIPLWEASPHFLYTNTMVWGQTDHIPVIVKQSQSHIANFRPIMASNVWLYFHNKTLLEDTGRNRTKQEFRALLVALSGSKAKSCFELMAQFKLLQKNI